MVPGNLPSQLEILSTGHTYYQTKFASFMEQYPSRILFAIPALERYQKVLKVLLHMVYVTQLFLCLQPFCLLHACMDTHIFACSVMQQTCLLPCTCAYDELALALHTYVTWYMFTISSYVSSSSCIQVLLHCLQLMPSVKLPVL